MLNRILTSSAQYNTSPSIIDHDHDNDENTLPKDVKEGHFAVHTVDDGELTRFVIELSYLANPDFLELLQQAEEEFGFKQIAERKKCLTSVKLFVKKMQNHLQLSRSLDIFRGVEFEEVENVPEDVKEGHFAIVAAKNEKPIRFVVELCVLQHPAFLKLLQMAEEEYGFQQKGALAVPCRPDELRRILQDKIWKKATNARDYSVC
ncbi:hypothetical protein BUALT_Bualt09G0080400 [Buddleja alternifolia]|uniref:Uncharacterized protein n=1 Tax=Buddleja alternifolia TaxID=168488 RepID=A0AAV6XBJ8_9LAMI|nr:hypothetical protein BUALT_Bualt09G0080400 [Buddleja alternifolia]